jgi:glycosyltransferase involved in cell wall biosynthesis
MRILSIHNRYQIRGGEDECHEAEVSLLREMGHSVEVYEENNDRVAALGALGTAIRTVWSDESYKAVKRQLEEQIYNIVHLQNFFPLISPAVYYAAKEKSVPVIQTLHNYRLLCPNAKFFRDGRACEDCLGKLVPYPSVIHGCYRESSAATGVVAAMLTMHRAMGTWTETVDLYIALTEFAREKFIQGGLPAEKIVVKPNFVHPDPGFKEGKGKYAIFVGRLSSEKGIALLLKAWKHLGGKIPLKIVGDGPLAPLVTEAVKSIPACEWLGRKPLKQVYDLMGEAAFLIFPSEWYEGLPRTIIEAFAVGTPVIAPNIGAMSSLINHGRTGLHFYPGNQEDLIAQVEWTLTHPEELAKMRYEVRTEFEAKYTAANNYTRLIEIYQRVRSI